MVGTACKAEAGLAVDLIVGLVATRLPACLPGLKSRRPDCLKRLKQF